MHPANLGCLAAARIDCCVLANNHVLDWGVEGLTDTLGSLHRSGIATAGAGRTRCEAVEPAVPGAPKGRLLVFAYACPSSGVPAYWDAGEHLAGVNFLADLSDGCYRSVAEQIGRHAAPGDLVMVSIHWGPSWGYHVPSLRRRFAQRLIDEAGVHLMHGHSSHHPLGIEVHGAHPVLYGCGDLINDYEGIAGYEEFRAELVLGYFLEISDRDRGLLGLEMVPLRLRRFRLTRPSAEDVDWLRERMDRECGAFCAGVSLTKDGALRLDW